MKISLNGKDTEVEYIRIHRDAVTTAFFALVDGQWRFFYKFRDKRLPTYSQVEWPNPQHMYGWSDPYRLGDAP